MRRVECVDATGAQDLRDHRFRAATSRPTCIVYAPYLLQRLPTTSRQDLRLGEICTHDTGRHA